MLKSCWLDTENITMRDCHLMLTLFKSLVLSRLDYASQLWSPYLLKHIYLIENVQKVITKHNTGIHNFSYSKRSETLKLYSLQKRRERDIALYMCGKLLKDWFQTSLIVGEEPVLYTMPCWSIGHLEIQ